MRRLATLIRDRIARILTIHHEEDRMAIKLVVKDKTVPFEVRLKAQQMLNSYPRYMRPTAITSRCIVNGNARSVILDHKMNKQEALLGNIPGVRKAMF